MEKVATVSQVSHDNVLRLAIRGKLLPAEATVFSGRSRMAFITVSTIPYYKSPIGYGSIPLSPLALVLLGVPLKQCSRHRRPSLGHLFSFAHHLTHSAQSGVSIPIQCIPHIIIMDSFNSVLGDLHLCPT